MPETTTVHRVFWYMNQPWVIGYRIKPFIPGWYQMVDIDLSHDADADSNCPSQSAPALVSATACVAGIVESATRRANGAM